MHDTRSAGDGHRSVRAATLGPLEQQQVALTRRMVLQLHERLQRKAALSVAHKRTATEILCGLCEPLAALGDAQMQALHDQYSAQSLQSKQQSESAEMHAMFEDLLGQPLEGVDKLDDSDALLQAAMRQLDEKAAAQKERRQARKATRPKSAKQKLAEQMKEDAQSALRTVYRQLASALHPDRETDPQERQRKTALMSQANAAYDRRDLTALLTLQLHLEHADPEAVTQLADDKVNALAVLLKEQVSALEHDLRVLEQQLYHEFDLPPYVAISPENMARYLAQAQDSMEEDLMLMERDLQRIQDEGEFKRWLKEQKQLSKESQSLEHEMDMLLRGFPGRR
jgi:hypothetical protein